MGRPSITLAVVSVVLATVALPARASVPRTGWAPASAGLLPIPAHDAEGDVAFLHTTRRIVPQNDGAGGLLLGHALAGLYRSQFGGGWVSLTPNCTSFAWRPYGEARAGLLAGCGVEGLAADPQDPATLFASTYNVDIFDSRFELEHGGIFRAELRGEQTGSRGSDGVVWRPLLPGVRGSALAVRRPAPDQPATLVVGRVQRLPGDVGADANVWCRALRQCSPSVYVSDDGGERWNLRTFTGSTCPDTPRDVATSSRIVGNLAFDPVHPNVIYAGANSGLWFSTDDGDTWSLALEACGSSPGFAATRGADGTLQRVYVGTHDGMMWSGATGATGPQALKPLALDSRIDGQILTVLLDRRDPSERTMFVAAWSQPRATGYGRGGVFKVTDRGDGTAAVEPLTDSLLDRAGVSLPQPYPIAKEPQWRPSLFLAQHPQEPDLLYASTAVGGVWVRSTGAAS